MSLAMNPLSKHTNYRTAPIAARASTLRQSGSRSSIISITGLLFAIAASFLAPANLAAQSPSQTTVAASGTVFAITNAKIYTLAGPIIENGTVVIRDGKIAAVGAGVAAPADAQVIDARGFEVYPGLFDPITGMGLGEVDQVLSTQDTTETGEYNPDVVAATAVNPASAHIPVTRAAGITHVVSVEGIGGLDSQSGGGMIAGQASAINLAGWTMADMAIEKSVAMALYWPSINPIQFDFATLSFKTKPYTEEKEAYDKQVNELADWLDRARHYAQAVAKGAPANYERDLKLEALIPVVQGKKPVLVFADTARDIRNSVEFCTKQNLKMILAGGAEAWKEKALLKQKNIPVILDPTMRLPDQEDYPYDKPMTQPAELVAAGVPIAFASFNTDFSRRLAQQAGNAVAYGLGRDEALKAVTLNAAKMFGLDDRLGTIEPGKMANVIVTDGDVLELRTQLRYLFIQGKLTSLDNKHLQLYEAYRKRPKASAP
jgi:imidazolonepropionase-like amidohydrolase